MRWVDAHACLTTLPPRKAEAMAKVKVEASRIPPSSVTISEDARSALVLSKGKTCKVVFDGIKSCMGCDNGVEMFSGLPCAESVAAVEKKGLCIEEFMHRCDKTSAWRDQYSHPELVMPSSAEVDAFSHLIDKSLYVPPVQVKRGKGRPKNSKRQMSFMEVLQNKKQKIPTCHHCWIKGHTQKTCAVKQTAVAAAAAAADTTTAVV